MSAFITTVRPDCAFIWTDGTIWDADARLIAVQRKCHSVPGAPMAVTGRGPVYLAGAFAKRLARDRISFDELIEHGEEITDAFLDEQDFLISQTATRATDLCIAGWSEKHGHPAVILRTTYPEADGVLFKIGTDFLAPAISDRDGARVHASLGYPRSVQDVEPDAYGIACMEAQRRTPGASDLGFEGLFVVGGHVLQTEVSASGVTHRVIHRWSDLIGERIEPVSATVPTGRMIPRAQTL